MSIFQVHIVLHTWNSKILVEVNVSLSNVWHERSLKLRFLLLFAAVFIWVKQSICSKECVVRIKVFWSNNTFFTRLLKPIFSSTRTLKRILFLCHHVSGRYTHLRVFSHEHRSIHFWVWACWLAPAPADWPNTLLLLQNKLFHYMFIVHGDSSVAIEFQYIVQP